MKLTIRSRPVENHALQILSCRLTHTTEKLGDLLFCDHSASALFYFGATSFRWRRRLLNSHHQTHQSLRHPHRRTRHRRGRRSSLPPG
jgi:hypothetical protein